MVVWTHQCRAPHVIFSDIRSVGHAGLVPARTSRSSSRARLPDRSPVHRKGGSRSAEAVVRNVDSNRFSSSELWVR